MTEQLLREKRAEALEALERLNAKPEMTAADCTSADELMTRITGLETQIKSRSFAASQRADVNKVQGRITPFEQPGAGTMFDASRNVAGNGSGIVEYRDTKTGQILRALPHNVRMADHIDLPTHIYDIPVDEFNLGRAIRGMITGRWDHADAEKRALAGGVSTAGGYLCPDGFATQFLDLARAGSSLLSAGAMTMPLDTDVVRIARLTSDPTPEFKGENADFTGSDPAFDSINLVPRLIGTIVKSSRELAEDAPNFSDIVTRSLTGAISEKIDEAGLQGDGTSTYGGIVGLEANASVQQLSGASLDYDTLLDAIEDVRDYNREAQAFITSPGGMTLYSKIVTGDGTNSAKMYDAAPADVKNLRRFATTGCGATEMYLGDFAQMILGLRTELLVEVTTTGDDSFGAHQVWIKSTLRFDWGIGRPSSLVRVHSLS